MCVSVSVCVCWGCSHGIEALVTECAVTCKLFWRLLRPCTLECDARAKVRLHSHVESEGAGVRERRRRILMFDVHLQNKVGLVNRCHVHTKTWETRSEH